MPVGLFRKWSPSDTTLHEHRKTRSRLFRAQTHLPHVVQIVGSAPEQLAESARVNVAAGADVIDINMGCPAKKVCNKLAGSALLSDEKLVRRIIEAVVSSVPVPVTLKIRTGPDRANRNGVRIAKIAQLCGIQALAVHGRTRADRFNGFAEYDTIAEIKSAVDIPVIANGDIDNVNKAELVLKRTGADAIMIGRSGQGNPWLFKQVSMWMKSSGPAACLNGTDAAGETHPFVPDVHELHAVLSHHIRGIHKLYGEYRGLRIARKHISWYCEHQPESRVFRNCVNRVDSAAEQLRLIDRYFECIDKDEKFASSEDAIVDAA